MWFKGGGHAENGSSPGRGGFVLSEVTESVMDGLADEYGMTTTLSKPSHWIAHLLFVVTDLFHGNNTRSKPRTPS